MTDTIPPNHALHPADAMLHASHLTELHITPLSLAESRDALIRTRWAMVYSGAVWALYERHTDQPADEPLPLHRGYRLYCTYTLQEGPFDLQHRTARQLLEACHE